MSYRSVHVVLDARTGALEGRFFQHFISIQFSWGFAERIIKIGPTVSEEFDKN